MPSTAATTTVTTTTATTGVTDTGGATGSDSATGPRDRSGARRRGEPARTNDSEKFSVIELDSDLDRDLDLDSARDIGRNAGRNGGRNGGNDTGKVAGSNTGRQTQPASRPAPSGSAGYAASGAAPALTRRDAPAVDRPAKYKPKRSLHSRTGTIDRQALPASADRIGNSRVTADQAASSGRQPAHGMKERKLAATGATERRSAETRHGDENRRARHGDTGTGGGERAREFRGAAWVGDGFDTSGSGIIERHRRPGDVAAIERKTGGIDDRTGDRTGNPIARSDGSDDDSSGYDSASRTDGMQGARGSVSSVSSGSSVSSVTSGDGTGDTRSGERTMPRSSTWRADLEHLRAEFLTTTLPYVLYSTRPLDLEVSGWRLQFAYACEPLVDRLREAVEGNLSHANRPPPVMRPRGQDKRLSSVEVWAIASAQHSRQFIELIYRPVCDRLLPSAKLIAHGSRREIRAAVLENIPLELRVMLGEYRSTFMASPAWARMRADGRLRMAMQHLESRIVILLLREGLLAGMAPDFADPPGGHGDRSGEDWVSLPPRDERDSRRMTARPGKTGPDLPDIDAIDHRLAANYRKLRQPFLHAFRYSPRLDAQYMKKSEVAKVVRAGRNDVEFSAFQEMQPRFDVFFDVLLEDTEMRAHGRLVSSAGLLPPSRETIEEDEAPVKAVGRIGAGASSPTGPEQEPETTDDTKNETTEEATEETIEDAKNQAIRAKTRAMKKPSGDTVALAAPALLPLPQPERDRDYPYLSAGFVRKFDEFKIVAILDRVKETMNCVDDFIHFLMRTRPDRMPHDELDKRLLLQASWLIDSELERHMRKRYFGKHCIVRSAHEPSRAVYPAEGTLKLEFRLQWRASSVEPLIRLRFRATSSDVRRVVVESSDKKIAIEEHVPESTAEFTYSGGAMLSPRSGFLAFLKPRIDAVGLNMLAGVTDYTRQKKPGALDRIRRAFQSSPPRPAPRVGTEPAGDGIDAEPTQEERLQRSDGSSSSNAVLPGFQ